MAKEKTTIMLDRDLKKEFMLFKIQTNAKSLEAVLRLAISKLKQELNKEVNKNEKKDFELDQEI